MKTCPNCGAKMGADVNFCTNCGADIRNVPLDKAGNEAQATQPVAPEQPKVKSSVSEPKPTRRSQHAQVNNQPVDSVQSSNQNANVQSAAVSEKVTNMWQWFVDSWKHPFTTPTAEKWYGWVTLLVENVLLILGLYICVNKYTQDQIGNSDIGEAAENVILNFSTSLLFELFLYLILTIVAMIAVAYYAHKFVYGHTENILDFVNRIVSCSNLSAILYVISFICLIIGSEDMLKIGLPLAGIAMILFTLAVYAIVVGDNAPAVQDKFYGLLIVVVVQVIVMYILGRIFGNAVYGQVQDLIHSSFNNMF